MPNRIIKETICTSDNLDTLSNFQEVFFYRLIVSCDDFGRMDARPKILSAKLFPLKDIRINQIEEALVALSSAELVDLYTVGGRPFLQMKGWSAHQRIRDSKAKYPGPENSDQRQISDGCGELRRAAASCGELRPKSNPIQYESEYESNLCESRAPARKSTHTENKEADPDGRKYDNSTCSASAEFNRFWKIYPRHLHLQEAFAEFQKVIKSVPVEKLIVSVEQHLQTKQWSEDGGKWIPAPDKFLCDRMFEERCRPAGGFWQRTETGIDLSKYDSQDKKIQDAFDDITLPL